MKNITVDFKNLLSELELKNLTLCFMRNGFIFIEDNQNNLYQMETIRVGSYLDQLIKDGIIVNFHQVEPLLVKNIGEWEKKRWDISTVEDFMKRQFLLN